MFVFSTLFQALSKNTRSATATMLLIGCLPLLLTAQTTKPSAGGDQRPAAIRVSTDAAGHKVTITADGRPFTEFIYPDSLEKPVLYPVIASDGQIVTRGFPIQPRPGEPTDHPHHIGIWFNYESVNGLDFWNNSYAIPAEKKHLYGWIRTDSIITTKSGEKGELVYSANWVDQAGKVLLKEKTRFIFQATGHERIIDRITTLTAMSGVVSLTDTKDGLLGMRVTRELQVPSVMTKKYTDDKGNVTIVNIGPDRAINGNYLTSQGKTGDSAWATRGTWCMLYGKKGDDTLSITMIDHPANPGYPTYWHARGYGLFAANPLGQKIFSNGKEILDLSIPKGGSATFRYRIVIDAGNSRMSTDRIRELTDEFAQLK